MFIPNAVPLSRLQQNLNTIACHSFLRENPSFHPFKWQDFRLLKFPASPLAPTLPYPQNGEGEGTFYAPLYPKNCLVTDITRQGVGWGTPSVKIYEKANSDLSQRVEINGANYDFAPGD